jgi:hypothetical protein
LLGICAAHRGEVKRFIAIARAECNGTTSCRDRGGRPRRTHIELNQRFCVPNRHNCVSAWWSHVLNCEWHSRTSFEWSIRKWARIRLCESMECADRRPRRYGWRARDSCVCFGARGTQWGHGAIVTKGDPNTALVTHRGRVPATEGWERKRGGAADRAARWCHKLFFLFLPHRGWRQGDEGTFLAIMSRRGCRGAWIIVDIGDSRL